MADALTTWLGLTLVLLAAILAVVTDVVRQREAPDTSSGQDVRQKSSRWVTVLTLATFISTGLAAVATITRFASII